jgi:small subunit ribosomal protein S4e
MSNHQKRLSAPTSWPVERKTETFTVKADAGPHGEDGVPLLILLRDVLAYVDSRKEAQYALDQDNVLVNGLAVSDVTRPIGMFDIVAFEERAENYRVFPDEGGRLALTSIDADAAGSKLGKIVEKRQVPGGDVQLTMHDGQTLLVDETAYTPNDSLVIDNDDGSVVVHFPYEEGALVTAVDGQHAGEIGTVTSIDVTPGSSSNTVTVETEDGTFETVEEYVVVIDENFTDDEGETETKAAEEAAEGDSVDTEDEPADVESLEDIAGVGPAKAEALREAGFESVTDVRGATTEELSEAEGVGEELAGRIKDDVGGDDA